MLYLEIYIPKVSRFNEISFLVGISQHWNFKNSESTISRVQNTPLRLPAGLFYH